MIYLSSPLAPAWWPLARSLGVGVMLTPKAGVRLDLVAALPAWAADNGCFTLGPRFNLAVFLDWLRSMQPARATCLFAVAPDVVGDAAATWERSVDVLPVIRALGYRAAYVAQDGLVTAGVPWGAFDALFVGGSTDYKLGSEAAAVVRAARARGVWAHWGRVNSKARLDYVMRIGGDSADGSYCAFNPREGLTRIGQHARARRLQLPLLEVDL